MTGFAILSVVVWGLGAPGPAPASQPAPRTTLRVTGVGYPPARLSGPRARLMARRAAEVVAQRNLAAELARLSTGVGGAGVAHRPSARIAGFRYVAQRDLPDGSVEVTIEWPAVTAGVRGWTPAASQPISRAAASAIRLPRPAVAAAPQAQLRELRLRIEHLERELGRVRALLRRLEPRSATGQAATQPATDHSLPDD